MSHETMSVARMPEETIAEPRVAQTFGKLAVGQGLLRGWSALHSYLLLSIVTVLCLIPFCGRAFHVDDTLFVWAAQHIAKQPLNPYGFQVLWEFRRVPLSDVTQNPPLASYYAALIGSVAGWSEWALHLGFIPVALALVLGTYRLAASFTRFPLIAALSTLFTPGLLVSAQSVMCDVMMLAIWVWAVVFWVEGLRWRRPLLLASAGTLIAMAALTKYFAISLVVLLFAYSLVRERRIGTWIIYLFIPVVALVWYQGWTAHLYGHGLLSRAGEYAEKERARVASSQWARGLITLSYGGGCALPALILAPIVWSRKQRLAGTVLSVLAGLSIALSWVVIGIHAGGADSVTADGQYGVVITTQLVLCIASGISIIGLALSDFCTKKSADALLLAMWTGGTLFFTAFVNWTINVRSVLPLIPVVGILLARRFDSVSVSSHRSMIARIAVVLMLCVSLSLWLAGADAKLANSARQAAAIIFNKTQGEGRTVWFAGHWGFQYYMELRGARPVDWYNVQMRPGDFFVLPFNNANMRVLSPEYVASQELVEVPVNTWASTISPGLGAGFYSSYWGPLPFAFGPVAPERYRVEEVAATIEAVDGQP